MPPFTAAGDEAPFVLPFDVRGPTLATEAAGAVTGSLVYTGTRSAFGPGHFGIEIYQATDPGTFELILELAVPGTDADRKFVLAREYDPYFQFQALWRDSDSFRLVACTMGPVSFDQQVTVEFDGGSVAFIRRGGDWIAGGLKPTLVMKANGALDSDEFSQQDYERLLYIPGDLTDTWQDYAVIFPAPIGEACGLFVRNALNFEDGDPPRAGLLDCELNETMDRAIVSVTTELL